MISSSDCRTCGACCIGDLDNGRGFADCTPEDVKRMSRAVRAKLERTRDGYASTPSIVTEEFGKSCAFLRGTPGVSASCNIYNTRPMVCRSFKVGGDGCKTARAKLGLEN